MLVVADTGIVPEMQCDDVPQLKAAAPVMIEVYILPNGGNNTGER
jgi:hypothetical protein